MENAILYFYVLLPPLLLVFFLAAIDVKRKLPWLTVFALFAGGMSLALLAALIWHAVQTAYPEWHGSSLPSEILKYIALTPFAEELLKSLTLIAFWRARRIRSISEGLLCGIALGFGFAACENLMFATETLRANGSLLAWYQIWFRSLHTPFLHGMSTAILGGCLGYHTENPVFYRRMVLPLAFLSSLALHAFWNLFGLLIDGSGQTSKISQWLMNGEILVLFTVIILSFFGSVIRKNQKIYLQALLRGSLGLVCVLLTVLGFHDLLLHKAHSSPEYASAIQYLNETPSVRKIIDWKPDALTLKNVIGVTKNQTALTVLQFAVENQSDAAAAEVAIVQIAGFWIVHDASFLNAENEKTILTPLYENLLNYFSAWAIRDIPNTIANYQELKSGLYDENLKLYLDAKQSHIQENYRDTLLKIDLLQSRTQTISLTLQYDKALATCDLGLPLRAATSLEEALGKMKNTKTISENTEYPIRWLQSARSDAVLKNFDPKYTAASATALISQIYYDAENFTKGNEWAKEAVQLAESLNARDLLNNALYLKAINLHASGEYKLADLVFDEILSDFENPNLTQKAWAYFYKSDVAIRENRHEDALNEIETAVNLTPKNSQIRQQAIRYLMERNYPNDLELALALALRGIDFGIEKDTFVDLASQLYQRLGIPDKTQGN